MNQHTYRHPHPGMSGRLLNPLLNSRGWAKLRRGVMSQLPFLKLRSNVVDIVYLNWVVESTLAQRLLADGVQLWERDGHSIFTVLS